MITVTIAASDSIKAHKAMADYVCKGKKDQRLINKVLRQVGNGCR